MTNALSTLAKILRNPNRAELLLFARKEWKRVRFGDEFGP